MACPATSQTKAHGQWPHPRVYKIFRQISKSHCGERTHSHKHRNTSHIFKVMYTNKKKILLSILIIYIYTINFFFSHLLPPWGGGGGLPKPKGLWAYPGPALYIHNNNQNPNLNFFFKKICSLCLHMDMATDHVLLFVVVAGEVIVLYCRVMCSHIYLMGFYDF